MNFELTKEQMMLKDMAHKFGRSAPLQTRVGQRRSMPVSSDEGLISLVERVEKGEIDAYAATDIVDKEITRKIGALVGD